LGDFVQLLEKIEYLLKDRAKTRQVKEVRIGLGYTAVLLDDTGLGLAYTFNGQQSIHSCKLLNNLRPLTPRPASDLLKLLRSEDLVEAAVGLATANALANRKRSGLRYGDILNDLNLNDQDRLGMVGMFAPLLPEIKKSGAELKIFDLETDKIKEDQLYPAQKAFELLPECNKVIITGTSLINKTLPGLLNVLQQGNRDLILLGASTPLLPEAFTDTPITILSGVIPLQNEKIMDIISWAGGMVQFKPYVQKVLVPIRKL
jgi:hypothetical protein